MKPYRSLRYLALSAAALLVQVAALAQDAASGSPDLMTAPVSSDSTNVYVFLFVVLFAIALLIPIMGRMGGLVEGEESFSWKRWWADLDSRLLTKAIPVEKEADHLLDHDYDGIKELDNALPPWWKWGFYITVILAPIYILYYHYGKGMSPEQEYQAEMKLAAADIEAYRKASNDNVDEKTVTMGDAGVIAKGKAIYQKNCFMCHGANGEGGVGPNLTDNFWLHGGSINDVFKTIKYGVPDKGMQAWEKMLSPGEIRELASFVKSVKGTNPPNGKAPQGDEYKEESASPPAAKDSSNAVAKK